MTCMNGIQGVGHGGKSALKATSRASQITRLQLKVISYVLSHTLTISCFNCADWQLAQGVTQRDLNAVRETSYGI